MIRKSVIAALVVAVSASAVATAQGSIRFGRYRGTTTQLVPVAGVNRPDALAPIQMAAARQWLRDNPFDPRSPLRQAPAVWMVSLGRYPIRGYRLICPGPPHGTFGPSGSISTSPYTMMRIRPGDRFSAVVKARPVGHVVPPDSSRWNFRFAISGRRVGVNTIGGSLTVTERFDPGGRAISTETCTTGELGWTAQWYSPHLF